MKKTNNLSIALLSKNPSEEKSLCKKLDEIDKMKSKILRESEEKITNFAIQHLYIVKYYDAKTGEQCRPPLKAARNTVLPRLTNERKQQSPCVYKKSTSLPECFGGNDCAIVRPTRCRSLSDKALPLSQVNLADKKGSDFAADDHESQDKSNSDCAFHPRSGQANKPKRGRSMSEVVPPKGFVLVETAQPEKNPRKFHAWTEKENEENKSKINRSEPAFKPKFSRSLSQSFAPSKLALIQQREGSSAPQVKDSEETRKDGTDAGKEGGIYKEGDKERMPLQRRVTVAGDAPSTTREFCRWQRTVKLVKDLPKSEQAEIFRGACFFRMALPSRHVPAHKAADKPSVGRQRKVSTVTAPCRQELSPSSFTRGKNSVV